jgi:hypothetical protein
LATTYKILGQQSPANTNNADLYTAPASTQTIVSSIVITNTSGTDTTFRIFARIAGATAGTDNALAYDTAISANSQVSFTLGITLSATDKITIRSAASGSLTFTAFGSELT